MGLTSSTCNGGSKSEEAETSPGAFDTDTVVEFFTDVEGNWEYFQRFVSKSSILEWTGEERGAWGPGTLQLKAKGMLVFGGDAPDKGPGDIRIIQTLTNLKRRFPRRVFIILGNRDIMKLRFYAELQKVEASEDIWMPTWDKKAMAFDTFIAEKQLPRNLLSKLKWLLHCTMGCQDTTFGTRKRELALLHGTATDEDVIRSYRDSVDPRSSDPWMLEYLKLARIGLVLGNTLFLHGGLQDESMGRIPGREYIAENVQDWVYQLNAWKDEQLNAYVKNPGFYMEDGVQRRNGEHLIEYATPGAGKSTVIYYNPFVDGNPVQRSPRVVKYLEESEILRVCTGHQPHGQTPTVVRHPATGLLVITADTSRSDGRASKLFNPADNRGVAISVVRLQGDLTVIEGDLVDGRQHACKLHCDPTMDKLPDGLVGRQLIDGAWVKTVVISDDCDNMPVLQTALGKGFDVKVELCTEYTVRLRLKPEFQQSDFTVTLSNYRDGQSSLNKTKSFSGELKLDDCRDADLTTDARISRSFMFDRDSFFRAKAYIFSLMGLFPAEKAQREKIVKIVNDLIDSGKRVIFITNNSNKTRKGLMDELSETYNIDMYKQNKQVELISPGTPMHRVGSNKDLTREASNIIATQHIVTSSNTCAWFLKQKGIKKPFVICSSSALLEELREFGINNYVATVNEKGVPKPEYAQEVTNERVCKLVGDAPDVDAIVVGWDQTFSALKTAVAVQYVKWAIEEKCPIPIISCSMDPAGILGVTSADFCKHKKFNNRKVRAVGNGVMTKAIYHCIEPDDAEIINVGKPSPILLEQLKRSALEGGLGLDLSTTVVIGTTLDTDIVLANGGGMKSLLLLSGVTTQQDVDNELDPSKHPTWILSSLADV